LLLLQVPAWFVRLGAAVFAKPIAKLYNASLAKSVPYHSGRRHGSDLSPKQRILIQTTVISGLFPSLQYLFELWNACIVRILRPISSIE